MFLLPYKQILNQWRNRPENLVMLCEFKLSLFVSLEIDRFDHV